MYLSNFDYAPLSSTTSKYNNIIIIIIDHPLREVGSAIIYICAVDHPFTRRGEGGQLHHWSHPLRGLKERGVNYTTGAILYKASRRGGSTTPLEPSFTRPQGEGGQLYHWSHPLQGLKERGVNYTTGAIPLRGLKERGINYTTRAVLYEASRRGGSTSSTRALLTSCGW